MSGHGVADDEWCDCCGESLPCACFEEDDRDEEDEEEHE